jgi:hypothetical protein
MQRAASISEKSVWRFSIGLQIASQSLAGRIIAAARTGQPKLSDPTAP